MVSTVTMVTKFSTVTMVTKSVNFALIIFTLTGCSFQVEIMITMGAGMMNHFD